jgi:hypothetical protein
MVECSGKSQGSGKGLSRSQFVHCEPHTDCPWREPGPPWWYSGQGRPETCAPLSRARLTIWRPFEPIFLKLFSTYNRAGEYFWGRVPKFGIIFEEILLERGKPEFTSTVFPIIPVLLAPLLGWGPGQLPGWRLSKLMQLPAGVTHTNFSSGFVPPEWTYCNLFQPSTVIHF